MAAGADSIRIVSLCMFGFGLVMIFQGLVSNWGGLMTTRWFLGVPESPLVALHGVLIRAQECLRPVYSPDVRYGFDRFLMSRKPDS